MGPLFQVRLIRILEFVLGRHRVFVVRLAHVVDGQPYIPEHSDFLHDSIVVLMHNLVPHQEVDVV